MISNSTISEILELTSKLLTLHDRDENRAKALGAISFTIDRLTDSIFNLDTTEIQKIRGIGKSVATSIEEIKTTGSLAELDGLIAETPEGVLELFKVKGIGVKKIKTLWKELGIDNLNELRIACENGKIAGTKGFGEKTQTSILESLVFIQAQAGKLRMDKGKELSDLVLAILVDVYPQIVVSGQIANKADVVDELCYIVPLKDFGGKKRLPDEFEEDYAESSPFAWRGNLQGNSMKIVIHFVLEKDFVSSQIIYSSEEGHLKHVSENLGQNLFTFLKNKSFSSQEEAYELFGSKFIPEELRVGLGEFELVKSTGLEELITFEDLKGTVHNHSTYSDGKHTLREMATFCKDELGLAYFGIADHSQSAAYAGGLLPATLIKQWEEIDQLNIELGPFKILKGIESDILANGSLDYENEILKEFDYVVASVHSGLNMDIEKATDRLIKAIENPYTTILGHPTGRLLLSRKGYPLDFKKIIDACAANNVVMELNASPYRLDIDWRLIPYCLEKGVKISINPDAHSTAGLLDMKYGVSVARKGGLTKAMTFNAMALSEVESFLKKA
ncbi:DNA polymerase (family 10) [Spirosomataceae bacterium TFI 002]|nr:DNA polymerase (family 10) [Spirosomataceae bacterium TFI 002]